MTALSSQMTTTTVRPIAPVTCGTHLGTIERRFGLLTSHEAVTVQTVIERCADLAVADRIAYLAAGTDMGQHAVVRADGWYYVVRLESELPMDRLGSIRPEPDAPRLLSIATSHGIVPQLLA